jgi:predicted TPR repeat methyltransferase
MLEKARQKNIYDQIYLGDLVSFMESHPNMYDAITCAATLIHFGDLLPVFDAAAVSLRDDGLFVFTLFLNNNESNDNEVVVAQEGNLAGSGCFAHGSNHVRRLAESAGFMIDVLESEIHEYHGPQKTIPIMGLIVALRRHTRMVGIDVQL